MSKKKGKALNYGLKAALKYGNPAIVKFTSLNTWTIYYGQKHTTDKRNFLVLYLVIIYNTKH